jgi:superfamily II DNA/RNA helicase
MIAEQKVEIRISQNKNIHSKIYILREKEFKKRTGGIEQKGAVITGSSNLTANGLKNNYEFNVELRDNNDISFALNEFEKLWTTAVELKADSIGEIKKRSYLKEITPYELYLKFLIEHFDDRIENDSKLSEILPKNFMKLAYQLDAVTEGIYKIKKHNGFFLADVVGLGKTITTSMIVKKLLFELQGNVLVIAPPAIQKEWEETFEKFGIAELRNYKIISLGALEKVNDISDYEIVIIDESHKFKNNETTRYKQVEKICKENSKYQKKVILISATPLNNKPLDIANQLYLFQDKRNSTIPSYPNLEEFFNKINKEYKKIIELGEEFDETKKEQIKNLAQKIRDDILREVMVRRTRSDILENEMYKKDLEKQGLTIPEVEPIEEIKYLMDDELTKIFDKTIDILLKKLTYERYKILYYLNEKGRKKFGNISGNIFDKGSLALAKLMQMLLIKRFESSFYAFKISLKRLEQNLIHLIDMFKNDNIIISAKANIFDVLEDDDADEKIEKLFQKGEIKKFKKEDFKEEYLEKLENELEIIKELNNLWKNREDDPKLEKFKESLSEKKDKKIVVFTESKDTAEYLKTKLKEFKVLRIDGENRNDLKETIRENFDANYPIEKQKNDYTIIITTDTLSEGVNLHRSNIIYNYDIPWNSTKLMQRIGRINRIGTKHNKIYIYNFIPFAKSDELIELSKKAFIKLQTFHSTFGEDNQIYSTKEEVESVELFEGVKEDSDEELKYLEEIRKFKKANPEKFKYLSKLNTKLRTQRKIKKLKNSTCVFIKNNNSKSYYLVNETESKAINFLEMAKYLKSKPNEKAVLPLTKFHYEQVNKALLSYEKELNNIAVSTQTIKIKNPTDKKALVFLKSLRNKKEISNEKYKIISSIIETGKYQNISKEIIKLTKLSSDLIEKELEKIEKKYSFKEVEEKKVSFETEIILSESFV